MKMSIGSILGLLFIGSYLVADMNNRGFEEFKNYYFVETGTYKGDGVKLALRAQFPSIHSVEIDHILTVAVRDLFKSNYNVFIYEGDSSQILYDIIKNFDKPITFWIDAHKMRPPVDSKKNTSVLEDLEQIKRHHIKTHTILIDDINCCRSRLFDFLTVKDVVRKVLEINPNYTIRFIEGGTFGTTKDAILVAEVKS
jgi:hypothetical protein